MSSVARAIVCVSLVACCGCSTVGVHAERWRYRDQVTRTTPAALMGPAVHADYATLELVSGHVITRENVGVSADEVDIRLVTDGEVRRVPRADVKAIELRKRSSKKLQAATDQWSPADGFTWIVGFVALAFVISEASQ